MYLQGQLACESGCTHMQDGNDVNSMQNEWFPTAKIVAFSTTCQEWLLGTCRDAF